MRKRLLVVIAFLSLGLLSAQNDPLKLLLDQLLHKSTAMHYLQQLTDLHGPRMAGSSSYHRAALWMESEFRKLGLDNVHTEPFSIPVTWSRNSAVAFMTQPYTKRLSILSDGWEPGLKLTEAPVVFIGKGSAHEFEKVQGKTRGAFLLYERPTLAELLMGKDPGTETQRFFERVRTSQGVALLSMADKPFHLNDAGYGIFGQGVDGKLASLPALNIPREEGLLLKRLLEGGASVTLRVEVDNVVGKAVTTENVLAEVPGTTRASEVVIVGAHLDSWELGNGVLDNGAGAAALLEIARAYQGLKLRPERTIRFIAFGAEEVGLLGSRAYVEKHKAEMARIRAVLIMDTGADKVVGFYLQGRKDLEPTVSRFMNALQPALDLKQMDQQSFIGTDDFFFLLQGIPVLIEDQDLSRYGQIHHTAADTLDKVSPEDYAQGIAALAGMAWQVANAPESLGERLTKDEVRSLLRSNGLENDVKAYGVYPK